MKRGRPKKPASERKIPRTVSILPWTLRALESLASEREVSLGSAVDIIVAEHERRAQLLKLAKRTIRAKNK